MILFDLIIIGVRFLNLIRSEYMLHKDTYNKYFIRIAHLLYDNNTNENLYQILCIGTYYNTMHFFRKII